MKEVNSYGWKAVIGSSIGYAMDGFDLLILGFMLTLISGAVSYTHLPVTYWDERLSTVMAERQLIAADVSRKKRKSVIDKMAAVVILQGYLDRLQFNK